MNITMNDKHIVNISQIKEFAKVANIFEFKISNRREKYEWINNILNRFKYFRLDKKDKIVVRKYIMNMTGISKAQLGRLVALKKRTGIMSLSIKRKHCFPRKYNAIDIALLIKTDNAHNRLSGPATVKILQREYEVFNRKEYANISNISSSHIYNLRNTRQYESCSLTHAKTKSVSVSIGERKKPCPNGIPGYIRVDSVHQGDLERAKGIYHINMVDEVTQFEVSGSVERISEFYLEPMLLNLINQFPYKIINFHSDNGSEYINKVVAKLLNKLNIKQTKSRSRKSNDNALVESKNGAIIRKLMGRNHIPQEFAPAVNDFYKNHLNIYVNYHRPSGFATTYVDKRGKEKKKYDVYMTPYDKFKSIPNFEKYLKAGIRIQDLDRIAYLKSDNDFAEEMQKAREELFKNFKHIPQELLSFITFVSGSFLD
jgi:transposase InsO family protein